MQRPDDTNASQPADQATDAEDANPHRLKVDYHGVLVRDLRVITRPHHKDGREVAAGIEVGGEVYEPTRRFWQSLFHRFGLTGNIFRYFRYDEVFTRVVESNPDSRLRLCAEQHPNGRRRLLAVSNPRRPVLGYDDAIGLLRRYSNGDGSGAVGNGLSYHDGVISSSHVPRSGEHGFDIGQDRFNNRFIVEVPVDGYGQPRIYLSLLRQVCSNGAVGYSRAFRSDVRVGEDAAYTLERALGQFDHDEGFAALRQRFESAQKSWASLHETLTLQRVLGRAGGIGGGGGSRYQGELDRVAGDLHALYGLANLDSLSVKRQRVLPAKCRVYDLINFASEVATHRASAEGRKGLQAYIGTLVSDEYDLEGTAERVPEFKDLFLNLN